MKIPIEKIIVSKDNPRQSFDEESLRRLGESIKTHGQLQAGIVRRKGSLYELVVGERRLRACALMGIAEFDAIVKDIDDITAMELRLIENTHREDLTNAEKGDAVLALWAFDKYETKQDVSKAIGIPYHTVREWVAKATKLSPKLKDLSARTQISERAIHGLLKYPHTVQDKLANAIIKFNIRGGRHGAERTFIKLYDENPNKPLQELAAEAKGENYKRIAVPKSMLSSDQLKEAQQLSKVKRIRKHRTPSKRESKEDVKKRLGLYSPALESQMKKTDFKFEKTRVSRGKNTGDIKPLKTEVKGNILGTTKTPEPANWNLCRCVTCELFGKYCKGRMPVNEN